MVHLRHADGQALAAPLRLYRIVDTQIAEAWGWFLGCPGPAPYEGTPVEDGGRLDDNK